MKKITLFLTAACAIAVLGVQLASAQTALEVGKKMASRIGKAQNEMKEKKDKLKRELYHAIFMHDLSTVKKLIDANPGNMYLPVGLYREYPMFCAAARYGNPAILQYMAEKKPGILKSRECLRRGTMNDAAMDDHNWDNALWLVKKNVPVVAPDRHMLGLVVFQEDLSKLQILIPYLLKQGADPYQAVRMGEGDVLGDLFYAAAVHGNVNFIKALKNATKRTVSTVFVAVGQNASKEEKDKRMKEVKASQKAKRLKDNGITLRVMWK